MTEDAATARQARRLATLAAMARPVQHELNNLLTVVFANVELLKRTAAEGAPQRQLDRIQQATKRLENATRSILTLSRRPVPEAVVAAPLDALRVLAPLLHLLLPAPGALVLELPEDDPWPVRLDRAAFDEALLTLAREAAASMPRGAGLGLVLAQGGEEVSLLLGWPAEAPPMGADLAAALAELGAVAQADGRLLLRWARASA